MRLHTDRMLNLQGLSLPMSTLISLLIHATNRADQKSPREKWLNFLIILNKALTPYGEPKKLNGFNRTAKLS